MADAAGARAANLQIAALADAIQQSMAGARRDNSKVEPSKLYKHSSSDLPDLSERHCRPHWRAFRQELIMVLMSLTIAGQNFWDKMCKQGEGHSTNIKVKTYDNFGPAPDLSNIDPAAGAWEMEVYKLIYFQLKGRILAEHTANGEEAWITQHRFLPTT